MSYYKKLMRLARNEFYDPSQTKKIKSRHKFYRFWKQQEGKCFYCQVKMVIGSGNSISATWDHLIPRAKGGTNDSDNLVLACYQCNQEKGSKDMEEYILTNPRLEQIKQQLLDLKTKTEQIKVTITMPNGQTIEQYYPRGTTVIIK